MVVQDSEESPGHIVLTPGGITDASLVIVRLMENHPFMKCELVSESLFGLISKRPADWIAKLQSRSVPVFTAANEQFDQAQPFAVSCELIPIVALKPIPQLDRWADGAKITELGKPGLRAHILKAVQCWGATQNLADDCLALQHLRRMVHSQLTKVTWHKASAPVGLLKGKLHRRVVE